jgi:hypothetical protein
MGRMKYTKFLIFIFIVLLCCEKQASKWPKHIFESLWVPQGAQRIDYYILEGSYQVRYEVEVCYPAGGFINTAANEMKKRGWKRLEYDFLNPAIKSNHARGPGGTWSHFGNLNRKDETYQWIEDWEDSDKNIVRYVLRYIKHMKGKVAQGKCDLKVNVTYITAVTAETLSTKPGGQDEGGTDRGQVSTRLWGRLL